MNFKTLILSLFICNVCLAQDAKPPLESIARAFLDTVQHRAYNTHKIDWETFRPNFIKDIQGIKEEKDLQPYFQSVIDSLKDDHSAIIFSDEPFNADGSSEDLENELKYMASLTDEQVGFPKKIFESKMIGNNYAYVSVPGTMTENGKYIKTIAEQMKNLDAKNPKAWIIDLTECWGGATWAVAWNFLSLLDENGGFYVVNNKNKHEKNEIDHRKLQDPKEIKSYDLVMKYNNLEKNDVIAIKNNEVPIVLLTSGFTGSAGEMFVAAFYGQENVTTMGLTTAGSASGNVPYRIGTQYMVNLTEAVVKDRKGKVYQIGEGIQPTIEIPIKISEYSKTPILTTDEYFNAVRMAKNEFIEGAVVHLNDTID